MLSQKFKKQKERKEDRKKEGRKVGREEEKGRREEGVSLYSYNCTYELHRICSLCINITLIGKKNKVNLKFRVPKMKKGW